MNYTEAYNKIIDAYFRYEIRPFDCRFCFCGNLHGNDALWFLDGAKYYTPRQYRKMEEALFDGMESANPKATNGLWIEIKDTPMGEEVLFKGMCAALEVLKDIHKSRGEKVDEVQQFTKRNLVPIDSTPISPIASHSCTL